MKTNKDDIRLLKSKHRLELVMQETGESFEVDAAKPDLWHSTITPGLTVDIRRQLYEIKKAALETEAGDVFKWLQQRYSWTFGMALKFLQKRAPDPKQTTPPALVEKKIQIIRNDEDDIKPLDKWQERALEIGGERMRKYFPWSFWNLILYLPEIRIEPTHAPDITTCPRCGERLTWHFEKQTHAINIDGHAAYQRKHSGPIPTIAYSIKQRLNVSGLGMEGSQELKSVFEEAQVNTALQKKIILLIANSFDGLLTEIGACFVEEEDGVVCEKCAWKEYDFQIALDLCKTSASRREAAEARERDQRDQQERQARLMAERERERDEARMYDEAAGLSVTAGRGGDA